MEMVSLLGLMEIPSPASLQKTKLRVKECFSGQMDFSIQGNGRRARCRARESLPIQMETNTKENILTTKSKVEG